jgi:hypothetical protein
MIESGKYASSAELAKAEKVNDSYLSRILRLTLLSPAITEAILSGRQAPGMELSDLLKSVPVEWAEQAVSFGSARMRADVSKIRLTTSLALAGG